MEATFDSKLATMALQSAVYDFAISICDRIAIFVGPGYCTNDFSLFEVSKSFIDVSTIFSTSIKISDLLYLIASLTRSLPSPAIFSVVFYN